jgi:hypothetical protein
VGGIDDSRFSSGKGEDGAGHPFEKRRAGSLAGSASLGAEESTEALRDAAAPGCGRRRLPWLDPKKEAGSCGPSWAQRPSGSATLLGLKSGGGGFHGVRFQKKNMVSPERVNLLAGHLG